jgi:DNA-binding transcriptional LysR family regulator
MSRLFGTQRLGSIELFCLTAQLQGFTLAANAAGLTPAAVSRSVARLESQLGVRLFVRTTRTVRLTEAGRSYYEQCRQALGQLAEAERELAGQQQRPSGLVRVTLPTPYGHCRVLPLVPAFVHRHPDIELDLQLTNRNVDIVDEGFDVAIRGRTPPDSGLVARKLEDAELVIVAAPSYLRRSRRPRSEHDLAAFSCIQFLLPRTGQAVPWLLRRDGRDFEWPTQGTLRCADDILATVTLVRAGAGVLQTYRFIVEQDLRDGTLEELLPDLAGASRPFSVMYPAHRHMPLRVRTFIDFLVRRLAR